jgi:hypothetical protein
MKKPVQYLCLAVGLALAVSAQAKIIVVNNVDNTNFNPGVTNLVTAINALTNGDTINFNITNAPAAGVHRLATPVGGYPIITNLTNITINGYSQPGSSPNTQTILSSNNANITIVIDSSNGECTDLTGINGYSQEGGVFSVLGCTNVDLGGLCFLGISPSGIANNGDNLYAIATGGGQPTADVHIHGCRFGLEPDNATVDQFQKNIVAYGANAAGAWFVGVITNSPNPVAEFNVFIGGYILMEIRDCEMHLSGNFLNVYPDGLHDFNVDGLTHGGVDHIVEALFELGSVTTNSVIGVDGDGINDAEKRNIIGGCTAANDGNVWECYGNGPVGMRFSGNYCGVGVDGATRFPNGGPNMLWLDVHKRNASTMIVGSDFDGVSDDLEGNLFYWNNPFTTLYGSPPAPPIPSGGASPTWAWLVGPNRVAPNNFTGWISVRGNVLVNNLLVPYMYADDSVGDQYPGFQNYMTPFVDTSSFSVPADIIPQIDPDTNIFPHVAGAFPAGIGIWTNVIIDVYELDPEGWANGALLDLAELTDNTTYTNGFPQGKKYLGSFPVANTGSFNIDLTGKTTTLGPLTLTVNYSADRVGAHNGRVQTGNFSNPFWLVPGSSESVGLAHIVPDVLLWYNTNNFATFGPLNPGAQVSYLGTWEPYISVLSDSTFLIQENTYADDGAQAHKRHMAALQPAAGGSPKLVDVFHDDFGNAFTNQIDESSQGSLPGRIAGDKRYGAVNYIAGGGGSPFGTTPALIDTFFDSDGRFNPNYPLYDAAAGEREAFGQIYSFNPAIPALTALTKALDISLGRLTNTTPTWPSGGSPELVRWGGDLAVLDNGNMLFVTEDRSGSSINRFGRCPDATILTPDGAIVKETFEIGGWTTNGNINEIGGVGGTNIDNEIWANVAAFRGGFAVRIGKAGMIYFYDDAGNFRGQVNIANSTGVAFEHGDRGDSGRIASDIRSSYLYYADKNSPSSLGGGKGAYPLWVAVWDTRTLNCVTAQIVSDTDTNVAIVDRAALAVDAEDRLCVAYAVQPIASAFLNEQIAARVLAFDGTKLTPLTPTFFPFVNHDSTGQLTIAGFLTQTPEVAMTTRGICIAGKGTVNSTNNPAGGPDTDGNTSLYAVIGHPAPLAAPVPGITVTRSGSSLSVSWNADDGLFTVQTTPEVKSSGTVWTDATPGDQAPPVSLPVSAGNQYIRLIRRF